MKLINANIASKKSDELAKIYAGMINSGTDSEEILVLVQSSKKRNDILRKIKKLIKKDACGKLNVYTFFGLCYNFISDNWTLIENTIKDENALIEPNLCGLEVTTQIFKNTISSVDFSGYNSRKNLLHQLLRRYSLICQNALTENEIDKKTEILKESFTSEVKSAINAYRTSTLNLRAFDYLRQIEAFNFLYKHTKNPYKYVFLDDADEITPACFEYLKFLHENGADFTIFQDFLGSSREGYLSSCQIDFEKQFGMTAEKLESKSKFADEIFEKVKAQKPIALDNIDVSTFIRRDEMLNFTIQKINKLSKKGVAPSEISIIAPNIDIILKYYLKKLNPNVLYLSGSEKLSQNPYVYGVLTLLKMVNGIETSAYDTRGAFLRILKVKLDDTIEVNKIFTSKSAQFQAFLELAKEIKDEALSVQIFKICEKFIDIKAKNREGIIKINQFQKQVSDFENVFGKEAAKKHLANIENSIISENPLSADIMDANSIIVATPQKIIDNEIKTKYQFWLDISSNAWLKQDIGPLYNAWVFQKHWNKSDFTLQDNLDLTLDKCARILRKLYLLNDERGKIYALSSFYDFSLQENFGGINKFFEDENDNKSVKDEFEIVPREDQEQVIQYKSGKMAVSAVAGSGKTTIMLALIMKLLKNGVRAENIFVLTFMDSAARNFKERIKANFPSLKELPHISTIHGLAHRILRENNNYAKLNIDEDFEIIDEVQKFAIVSNILFSLEVDPKKIGLYSRAISTVKNQMKKNIETPLLKRIYGEYEAYKKENNLLDYDDLLTYSLKILNENEDVKAYYQGLAHFVIEDEAQDSSFIQQELIRILGEKCGNIIRCGDCNQSITATFTNSDVLGFREFINSNKSVKMDHSQRCAKKIYTLANNLLDYAENKGSKAFLNIKMQEVQGKNPKNGTELVPIIFKNQFAERNYILKTIKEIMKKEPNATIAVLLRSNKAVDEWAEIINSNAIKAKTRRDTLILNPVFNVVLTIFDFVKEPNNSNAMKCFKVLREYGFYKNDTGLEKIENDFISNDNSDFEIWWDLREFLSNCDKNAQDLALIIANYYFSGTKHELNIAPIVLLVGKIYASEKSFEKALLKLHDISTRANYGGARLFEIDEEDTHAVNLMTLHKSKGDEFDYVFIPELTKDSITLDTNDIKLREDTMFIEALKKKVKNKDEIKTEIADENYRLLYVAITRAKRCLHLSCANEYKIYSRVQKKEPCAIFCDLLKVEVKND